MEVPGKRKDPDLEKGSQENSREFCQPCGCDSKHVPAEGFCQTCGDYLCAECFKVHTIPRPMRNHVLLDKANMPRSSLGTRKPKSICTITCPRHNDKVIEFFCPAHDAVLCGVSAVIKHKQCDTVYIPDVAEEYKTSKEFADLLETINHLDKDIKTLSGDIEEATSSVKKTSAKAIQEIQQFRKELNDYLDKKEQELILATKRIEQEDTKLFHDLTNELDSLKNENSSFKKQIKSVDSEIGDLFITSKQMMKQVQLVLDRFTRCAKKNEDISYRFEHGQALKDLLASNTDFGKIKKTSQPKNASYSNQTVTLKTIPDTDFTSKPVERPNTDFTSKPVERPNTDFTSKPVERPFTGFAFKPVERPNTGFTSKPVERPNTDFTSKPVERPFTDFTSKPVERPFTDFTSKPVERPNTDFTSKPVERPNTDFTSKPVERPNTGFASKPVERPFTGFAFKPVEIPNTGFTSKPVERPNTGFTSKPVERPFTGFAFKPVEIPNTDFTSKPVERPNTDFTSKPVERPTTDFTSKPVERPNTGFAFKPVEIPNTDFTYKLVERKSDIKVETSEETGQPRITGMVLLSPYTLLLADHNNNSVKTMDTTSYSISSRLTLSGRPWDIELLPQDQAAVTLPINKMIQMISTKDRLSEVRTVYVKGRCFGISATKDNLVVSFTNPSKVDIMDFQGTVLVSVRSDSSGQTLFSNPWYNTILVENRVPVINVSDTHRNCITKLSVGGQVLSTYTHKNWEGLRGMTAIGDGQLLVSDYDSDTVDVISQGGKRIQTLLDSTHGIQCPESICYCAEQKMLYVSSNDDTVQAYKFT